MLRVSDVECIAAGSMQQAGRYGAGAKLRAAIRLISIKSGRGRKRNIHKNRKRETAKEKEGEAGRQAHRQTWPCLGFETAKPTPSDTPLQQSHTS